jgi:sodium-dependent dicarboxylate transporter 2/3/5
MNTPNTYKTPFQLTGLLAGPAVFVLLLLLSDVIPLEANAVAVLAVAAWMLIWWVTEAVGIAVTALLPMILFPFLDVKSLEATTASYGHKIIFLFMGGFGVALAMEKHNLHRRIALVIVKYTIQWVGLSSKGLVLGFMLATAFLSMWISNTATTVMMLPIAASVIALMNDQQSDDRFTVNMLLGIAYSANVGGIATIVGTPPNAQFASIMSAEFGIEVGFGEWFLVGFPFSLTMLIITYLVLTRILYPTKTSYAESSKSIIHAELQKLGRISVQERKVLIVFVGTALLWMGKGYLSFLPFKLSDTGISMTAMVLLFVIPAKHAKGEALLAWQDTSRLPWGILLLFGGGLALAKGLSDTGIISMIGQAISSAGITNTLVVMLLLTAVMLFMTEIMSNVALTTVFVPIVAAVAGGMGADYLAFTIPVTIASSCAFMLPMSTPPNAIVFSSGQIKVAQMVRAGILLNIIAILLTATMGYALVGWVFGG